MESDTPSENVAHVLDAARAAIDAEFRRAERFDAKARGQATLAGSWFAVTQAIAATSLTADTPKGWTYGLVAGLLLQAGALSLLLRASARVWRLQTREDVGTTSLRAMERGLAVPPQEFASHAIDFYCRILDGAKVANKKRAEAFDARKRPARFWSATFWWWPVLIVGLAEIAAALLSRTL